MTKTTAASLLLLLSLAGCDPEYDMGKQPKHKPNQHSTFYADGLTDRLPVPGTVTRDAANVPGYPYAHALVPTATAAAGEPNPVPINRMTMEQGQVQFTIYCSACHGRLGNGNGMIAQRGLVRPPSFHAQRLKDSPDSHFFNVMSRGYGAMLSYDDRIAEQDRWKIVAYIRALQLAGEGANVSDADKAAFFSAGDVDRNPKPSVSQQGSGQ